MGRSCLDGYLTDGCKNCPNWADGTDGRGIGCTTSFPIDLCPHFKKMMEFTEKVKRFKVEFVECDGNLKITGENDGFSALEVVGLLEMKKEDIIDQVNHQTDYERTAHTADGRLLDISKKEGTDE